MDGMSSITHKSSTLVCMFFFWPERNISALQDVYLQLIYGHSTYRGEPPGVFQLVTCNSETGWVTTISCCLSIAIAMLVHVIDMLYFLCLAV